MSVELIRFEPDDLADDELRQVSGLLSEATGLRLAEENIPRIRDSLAQYAMYQGGKFGRNYLVLTDENIDSETPELAGVIRASHYPSSQTMEINAIAVDSKFRGTGLARRALAFAEAKAFADGVITGYLLVDERNEQAKSFYDKVGYTTEEIPANVPDIDTSDSTFELRARALVA